MADLVVQMILQECYEAEKDAESGGGEAERSPR